MDNIQIAMNEAANELQQKLKNGLILTEPTEFLCIDIDGGIVILNSRHIPTGTVIGYDNWEAVLLPFGDEKEKPWVLGTGLKMSHETFAQMMRSRNTPPKIIYWGLG